MVQVFTRDQAQAYVADLYRRVAERWEERVMQSEFMTHLCDGSLPLSVFRLFFRNFGTFTIEINTMVAASYQRYLHFFRQYPDLMEALGEKIADEFIHPRPPGHVLLVLQTARALDIDPQEIYTAPYLPEFRCRLDFARAVLYEGTPAEWFALSSNEEMIGHWAGACYTALTTHYGLTPEQVVYFSKHHEADLEEHDEGVMGHGQFNRLVLQRLLESGQAWERPTYGIEYCAMTFVDLFGVSLRGIMDVARRQRLVPD
ncbi:MAG TPA: iron-containing redox enzyme family protein [Chloroflexota bacterium]|nr:iron-containing redox enzyme family protein [Chloroflexota bacterium]